MKLIKTERYYLNQKIRECKSLIKYSNCFKVKELTLNIEEYKKQLEELKIENKRINHEKQAKKSII